MSGRKRKRVWLRWLLIFLGLVVVLVVAASATFGWWGARAIVYAPNFGKTLDPADDPSAAELGAARMLRVAVRSPSASIAIYVIEPAGTPRGTLLVLHGVRDSARSMSGLGRKFAGESYRTVLVDLRGHGRSSGDWLTFGVVESRDLVQVIDALEGEGLLAGKLGVYGASYGGATAIQLAARDPRVAAVVAVAPFSTMREVVNAYADKVAPSIWLNAGSLRVAIARSGRLAHFDPDEADAVRAIGNTRAPVLLIHGRSDETIPSAQSERLHAAAPGHSEIILLDGIGHGLIFKDPTGEVLRQTLAWFGCHLR